MCACVCVCGFAIKDRKLTAYCNSLARAFTGTSNTQHIIPVLKSLKWLKMKEFIHHKIISLTYDLLHTSQSQYLRKLINI